VTDEVTQPNGLCFSPDYRRLYVSDTGAGEIKAWEVDGGRLRNGRRFVQGGADGIRCDADGNVWGAARPGVQIFAPGGEAIGTIRLPEICGNVCFGGPRRNRLFMTASQSLYAVYVDTVGAHIA
jgi:gluconolactonase